jgi:hypothetical protein
MPKGLLQQQVLMLLAVLCRNPLGGPTHQQLAWLARLVHQARHHQADRQQVVALVQQQRQLVGCARRPLRLRLLC